MVDSHDTGCKCDDVSRYVSFERDHLLLTTSRSQRRRGFCLFDRCESLDVVGSADCSVDFDVRDDYRNGDDVDVGEHRKQCHSIQSGEKS